MLQAAGLATSVVTSAGEAFTWLTSIAPDIVILDVHLPDVPGTEVLRQMRASARLVKVPVIVVTAHMEMAEEIEDEVDLVLVKPIRYGELKGRAVELAGKQ